MVLIEATAFDWRSGLSMASSRGSYAASQDGELDFGKKTNYSFRIDASIMGFLWQSKTQRGLTCMMFPKTPIASETDSFTKVKDKVRNPFRRKSKKSSAPEPAKQA